jgi:hypothetical protein
MLRVFLDQSRWIKLARVAGGKDRDEGVAQALDLLRAGVERGLVSVPLTSWHYMETNRRRQPDQRRRLGALMWEISQGHSMAPVYAVTPWEIEVAVYEQFGGVPPSQSPRIFGTGVAHAFGQEDLSLNLSSLEALNPGERSMARSWVRREVERNLIGGPPFELPAHGIARPGKEVAERWARARNERLTRFVEWGVSDDRAWRMAVAAEYQDILDMLLPVLDRAGADLGSLADQGPKPMSDFLRRIPIPYAMACLEHAAMRSGNFVWEANDFVDLITTAYASSYCDVVVGETKWVNLLGISRAEPRAKVTKDLSDLPRLLTAPPSADADHTA